MAHDRLTSIDGSSGARPRRHLHRSSMSETESAAVDTLEAQHGTFAPDKPVNTRRKQSFLHVTAPEEEFEPTATSTPSRLSTTRRKQSFLHVTAARASHGANHADIEQLQTRAASLSVPHQEYRRYTGLAEESLEPGDSTGSEFVTAVQGTLGMIREHREYLDRSRAAARRNEDILARLAATPTASWKAKQKPSVGIGSATGTAHASETRLPRPVPVASLSRSSNVTRARPGTALADRIVTNVTTTRGSLVSTSGSVPSRRRSASIDSVIQTSVNVSQFERSPGPAAAARGPGRGLVHTVGLPHANDAEPARPSHTSKRFGRPALALAGEAMRSDRILLDATMPASPAPLLPNANRSQPHAARTAARQPQLVPQTSAAQTRSNSTFSRTVRPDPFAPKAEINTRLSGTSGASARQLRLLSNVSLASQRGVHSEASDSCPQSFVSARSSAEQSVPRRPKSDAPAWQRLSQQSTVSWSSKGKAPMRDEDHLRNLQAMIENRPVSMPSSLQPPNSARISWVGEDFETCMEGSICDRSCDVQRSVVDGTKTQLRLRQDSGTDADVDGAPVPAAQNQQSALVSSLDLAASPKYDEVVTAWHDDAGWLFSIAEQNRPNEYESLTSPLKSIRARRFSSKLDAEFPSAESFQAMIDRAHKSMGKPRRSTATVVHGPETPSAWTPSRTRRDSSSFMTRTKNFLMAPFRLGNKFRVSGPGGRPRRGSTGSLLPPRPTIVHHLANGTKVTYSHANSLRPEHNPALLRTTVPGGQPQTARLPRRRTAQPRVRSSLATHEEKTEDEEEPPSWINMNVHELPADEIKREIPASARGEREVQRM